MAGDWIKWSLGFARKPEVMQIAVRLGRSRHEIAAILMEVYEWADANVIIDSNASGFDPDKCPGVVQLGEQSKQLLDAIAGVAGLADAMTAVGWLQARSGSLTFPNFGRHNGKSAKARALDSARKRAGRSTSPDQNRTGVPNVSGSEPDKKRTREREREVKDNSPPESSGAEPPATLPLPKKSRKVPDTPHHRCVAHFCDAWQKQYGSAYPFNGGKDGDSIKAILAACDGDESRFRAVADRYFADGDSFVVDKRHQLGLLRSQLPKWLVPEGAHGNGSGGGVGRAGRAGAPPGKYDHLDGPAGLAPRGPATLPFPTSGEGNAARAG